MKNSLDKTDQLILSYLIKDARMAYTEIAKLIKVSPGTIHVRVNKMEQNGIIQGASINVNYEKVGYRLTSFIGIVIGRTKDSDKIISSLKKIPEITVANFTTGQFGAFCKIRCKDTSHAKEVIFKVNEIQGILRTESMISMEEPINDKIRLFNSIFNV